MHTTEHPPSPASRVGTDLPTNVQAISRAVRCVNTHRPRFQVRARPSHQNVLHSQFMVCVYCVSFVFGRSVRLLRRRRASRESGLLCSHSHGESIDGVCVLSVICFW